MTQTQQVGTPERRSLHRWWVASGQVGYTVERIEGRWRCTCPSFRWRHARECKHIAAVRRQVSMA